MGNEVKLTVLDRVMLPSVLKKEANYMTLIINKDIKKKVDLTQDELVKFKFKSVGQGLTWSVPEDIEDSFSYSFTNSETTEIFDCLNKLNSENKLTEELTHLYEIFNKM